MCSDAWTAFLPLPLPQHVYKRLLQRLTSTVIPHLRNPILLSDFLTRSIDQGGLVGILSLHGLFILVTQHGFEYPQFYQRLYNLLTPQVKTPSQSACAVAMWTATEDKLVAQQSSIQSLALRSKTRLTHRTRSSTVTGS